MEIIETDLQSDLDGGDARRFTAADYEALNLQPLRRPGDGYLAHANTAAANLFHSNGFRKGGVVQVDGHEWIVVGFNGCAYFHDAVEEVDPRLTVIVEDPSLGIQRYMTLQEIQKENPNGSTRAPIGQRVSRTVAGIRTSLANLFR